MATSTTTTEQSQAQKAYLQQKICRYCKKPGPVIKECSKDTHKEQEQQGGDQPQKHTQHCISAKKTSTQQKCAGRAQKQPIDPKGTKPKISTKEQRKI